MFVVHSGQRILSAEKSPPNASIDTMVFKVHDTAAPCCILFAGYVFVESYTQHMCLLLRRRCRRKMLTIPVLQILKFVLNYTIEMLRVWSSILNAFQIKVSTG